MNTTPIVLVPGLFGAWAWDEVAAVLRADGHEVTALTLPGLESHRRRPVADHARRPRRRDLRGGDGGGTPRRACRAQRGAGFPGYAASDRVPELIAAMVYVDTGPIGAMDADFEGVEMPLPPREKLQAEENLDGLSQEQLETFERRAVSRAGGVLGEALRC